MKRLILLILIMAVAVGAAACKPTPPKNAVQSKAGDELMSQIMNEAGADYFIQMSNEVLGTNEPLVYIDKHYTNEYIDSSKNISIEIDADVYLPVESKLPVVKVEQMELDQETVDRVINIFMQGESVYETYLTRDMLEKQILLVKQRIATFDEDKTITLEDLDAQLEYLIDELNNIDENLQPEDINISKPDEIISRQGVIEGNIVQIVVDAFKDNPFGQSIRIRKSGEYISVNDYCENFSLIYLSEEQLDKIRIEIDKNAALDEAVKIIEALGIANLALYSTDIAIPSQYDLWTDDSHVDGGYIFEFKRAVNGVPSSDIIYIQEYMEGELGYSPIWKDEKITIVVNEQGIADFNWQSPSNVVEILNDDVEIMSFEESIDIAMQQMSNSLWSHDGIINQTLIINKITLDLARVKIKGSDDEYMLIPVWKFYGENWVKYTQEYLDHPDAPIEDKQCINKDGELYRSNTAEGHPYLVLNAIDGTVIDSSLGY